MWSQVELLLKFEVALKIFFLLEHSQKAWGQTIVLMPNHWQSPSSEADY
jgi:hypothetical protein